jgi:hypothetical protein
MSNSDSSVPPPRIPTPTPELLGKLDMAARLLYYVALPTRHFAVTNLDHVLPANDPPSQEEED